MKLVKITFGFEGAKGDEGHWHVLLETEEDLLAYFETFHRKQTAQLWEFLKIKDTAVYDQNARGVERVMTAFIQSQPAGKRVTVVGLCDKMDSLHADMMRNMLSFIHQKKGVKVNFNGGYSCFDRSFFKVLEEVECDEQMMRHYLLEKSKKAEAFLQYLTNRTFVLTVNKPNPFAETYCNNAYTMEVRVNRVARIGYYTSAYKLSLGLETKLLSVSDNTVTYSQLRYDAEKELTKKMETLGKKFFAVQGGVSVTIESFSIKACFSQNTV